MLVKRNGIGQRTVRVWVEYGRPRREDGPAIELSDGTKVWWDDSLPAGHRITRLETQWVSLLNLESVPMWRVERDIEMDLMRMIRTPQGLVPHPLQFEAARRFFEDQK